MSQFVALSSTPSPASAVADLWHAGAMRLGQAHGWMALCLLCFAAVRRRQCVAHCSILGYRVYACNTPSERTGASCTSVSRPRSRSSSSNIPVVVPEAPRGGGPALRAQPATVWVPCVATSACGDLAHAEGTQPRPVMMDRGEGGGGEVGVVFATDIAHCRRASSTAHEGAGGEEGLLSGGDGGEVWAVVAEPVRLVDEGDYEPVVMGTVLLLPAGPDAERAALPTAGTREG